MHDFLYDLKEKLLTELERYAKSEVSNSNLGTVDTLAHAAKNICKIIDECEKEEYSGDDRSYEGDSYRNNGGRRSYRGDSSYRRRRDAMGRYSRDEEMISELRKMMENAPDDRTRSEFERFISKMEQM